MGRLVYIVTQILYLFVRLCAQTQSDPPPPELLEDARRVALNYTAHLPDFLCTQIVHRSEAYGAEANFRNVDTLTVQVSFFQLHEDYKLIARNNKPTKQKLDAVGGATSQGEFGSTLLLIFHKDSRAEFLFNDWELVNNRRAAVYTYRVDSSNSHWQVRAGPISVIAGYHGQIYIDPVTKSVLRIVEEVEIPRGFPVDYTNTTVDYDFVDVSGHQYLLPVRSETDSADLPRRPRAGQTTTPAGLLATQRRYRNISD